jgi:hypothetical protein
MNPPWRVTQRGNIALCLSKVAGRIHNVVPDNRLLAGRLQGAGTFGTAAMARESQGHKKMYLNIVFSAKERLNSHQEYILLRGIIAERARKAGR